MSYVKQTWATGDVITAEKLNHMEDGIADAGGTSKRYYVIPRSDLATLFPDGVPLPTDAPSTVSQINVSGFILAKTSNPVQASDLLTVAEWRELSMSDILLQPLPLSGTDAVVQTSVQGLYVDVNPDINSYSYTINTLVINPSTFQLESAEGNVSLSSGGD